MQWMKIRRTHAHTTIHTFKWSRHSESKWSEEDDDDDDGDDDGDGQWKTRKSERENNNKWYVVECIRWRLFFFLSFCVGTTNTLTLSQYTQTHIHTKVMSFYLFLSLILSLSFIRFDCDWQSIDVTQAHHNRVHTHTRNCIRLHRARENWFRNRMQRMFCIFVTDERISVEKIEQKIILTSSLGGDWKRISFFRILFCSNGRCEQLATM